MLESLSVYWDSPSEWGSKIKEVAVGFFAIPAAYHPSHATVATILPLVEQATGIPYCRHCLHAQPRCTCTGASGEVPRLPALTLPVSSSASTGPSVSTGATGSTAVVTPMSSLSGPSTRERRDPPLRVQIDEMKRRTKQLQEEANQDWMEYQRVSLELRQAEYQAEQRASMVIRPPGLRLNRPPTPAPTAALGRPPAEAPLAPPPSVQQPPTAPPPTWSERVETAESMDVTQEGPKVGTPYQQQVKAPTGTTGIGLVRQKAPYSEAVARGRGAPRGRSTLRGVSRGGTPGRGGGRGASSSSSRERVTSPEEEEADLENPAAASRYTGQKKPKYRGWKNEIHTFVKDVAHKEHPNLSDREILTCIHTVLEHMDVHYTEWYYRREMEPLGFMPYVAELFLNLCNLRLRALPNCHGWIKPHGFHHQRAATQLNFKDAKHLQGLPVPTKELPRPSVEARTQAKKGLAKARQVLNDCRNAPASLENDVASNQACKDLEKALVRYEQLLNCYGEVDADTRTARLELEYMETRGSRRRGSPPKQASRSTSKGGTPKSSGTRPQGSSPRVGGGGDASSSQPRASPGPGDREDQPPSYKRKKGADGKPTPRPSKALPLPFPLAPNKDRKDACDELMDRAPDQEVRSPLFYDLVLARFPRKGEDELVRVSNQLYISCVEYHLTMASRAGLMVSPQVPLEVSDTLRPLQEYLPEGVDARNGDYRIVERARTLRLLCWVLRADTQANLGPDIPFDPLSTLQEDFPLGPVLRFLLAPQVTSISYEEVVTNVLHENLADQKARAEDLEDQLEELMDKKDGSLMRVKKLEEAVTTARGSSSPSAIADAEDALTDAQARLKCTETAIKRQKRYIRRAWEAYELGCERLHKEQEETPPEEPPQETEQERMEEEMEAEVEEEPQELGQIPASQEAGDNVITAEDDKMLDDVEEQQTSVGVSTELSGLNLHSPSGAGAAPRD